MQPEGNRRRPQRVVGLCALVQSDVRVRSCVCTIVRTGAHVGRTPVAVHLALNGQQYGPQAAAPYEYLVDDPSLHYGLSPYGTPAPPPPPPHLFGYEQGLDILGQAA